MSHTTLFFRNVASIIEYDNYIHTLDYLLQSIHFLVKKDPFMHHINQFKHKSYDNLIKNEALIDLIMIHLYILNHNQYMAIEYEMLIFKILLYLFLIVYPVHFNIILSNKQKTTILNDCFNIYNNLLKNKTLEYIIIGLQMDTQRHFWDCFNFNTHYIEQKLNDTLLKLL